MTDHFVKLSGQAEMRGGELGGGGREGHETGRRRHARTGALDKTRQDKNEKKQAKAKAKAKAVSDAKQSKATQSKATQSKAKKNNNTSVVQQ